MCRFYLHVGVPCLLSIHYNDDFKKEEYVWFSIEIEKVLNGMNVARTSLELLLRQSDGKSVVRLAVKKKKVGDDDNDNTQYFLYSDNKS